MSMFSWMAPLFGRFGDRWDDDFLTRVADQLRPFLDGRRALLDLGGGTGALAARLSDLLAAHATVLDPTPEMIAQMKPHVRVTAEVGSAESMPLPTDSFDACLISDAFHHFRDQDGAVREIARVVRPGGGLVVLEFEPKGWMLPIVMGERLLGEPGAFMTTEEMCAFMARHGIDGRCERVSKTTYYFVGTVR